MSENIPKKFSLKKRDKIQKKREVGKTKSSFVTTPKRIHTISLRGRLLQASDKQIPNSETTIVQLAEKASWIEQAVQKASWTELTVQKASWTECTVQLAERAIKLSSRSESPLEFYDLKTVRTRFHVRSSN